MNGRNHKTVPGEPTKSSKDNKSQNGINRNIIVSIILGAFLFGLGCDLQLLSVGSIGIALITISIYLIKRG
jgi:hypothetical protein|nr:MAG TPA: hypothetical protein [Bacteriophage sp.]